MGEHADDIIDAFFDHGRWDKPPRNRSSSGYQRGAGKNRWKIANGDIIEMSEMSTDHIMNCIRHLERLNPQSKHGKITEFEEELKRRNT